MQPEKELESEGEILVALFNDTVYIKPFGFATQKNALGLPGFLNSMFQEGSKRVTFDLEECKGMDSTFLGVIATAALSPAQGAPKRVVIINAAERHTLQLQRIGLLDVVACRQEAAPPPPDLQLAHIDFFHLPNSDRERIKRIKELHEQLINLNARNRKNFSSFVKMLDSELGDDVSS